MARPISETKGQGWRVTLTQCRKPSDTSGYAMVVDARPKTPKNRSFLGSPSPQGSHSPYILGDTTRPGRITCFLV